MEASLKSKGIWLKSKVVDASSEGACQLSRLKKAGESSRSELKELSLEIQANAAFLKINEEAKFNLLSCFIEFYARTH